MLSGLRELNGAVNEVSVHQAKHMCTNTQTFCVYKLGWWGGGCLEVKLSTGTLTKNTNNRHTPGLLYRNSPGALHLISGAASLSID